MNRLFSLAGALLVIAGVAILAYVAYAYVQQQQAAAAPHWSKQQQQKGKAIAARLATPQRVSIPKRLQSNVPPPGIEPAVRIVIPKIDVDAPVVQTAPVNGVWDVADWAVGHLTTTPNPGARGNGAYSAHDDIKGEVFKRVGELKPGDRIELRTAHAVFTYVVTDQLAVDPSDVSVLNPTSRPTVTLISCTPYWVDSQRLVVQAVFKSEAPA